MNVLKANDVIPKLKNYCEYLENKVKEFKQEIQEHWNENPYLQSHFLIETTENSELKFSIPALRFGCCDLPPGLDTTFS